MATDEDQSVPRCGYPTKGGKPCRMRVPQSGKVCRVHQKAALLDRILTGRIPRADAAPSDNSESGTA